MPNKSQLLQIIATQSEIAKLGLSLDAVMRLVVERALPLTGADGSVIELAEGDDMVYRAAAGTLTPYLGLRLARQGSLSGLCVEQGKTMRSDDTATDPRVDLAACRKVGAGSMLVLPLRHGELTVGVLKVISVKANGFDASHEELLTLLSDVVAAAMYYAAAYDANELFRKATHDSLTGLPNRALFMDRLRTQLDQSRRHASRFAVLMIDMNGLKSVNDTLGHRAGDALIAGFAERLKASARQSDTVARLGGDEFAALLTPIDGVGGIAISRQRLQAEMARGCDFDGRQLPLAASVGAALYPDDCDDITHLLELADQRMYEDKRQQKAGRG